MITSANLNPLNVGTPLGRSFKERRVLFAVAENLPVKNKGEMLPHHLIRVAKKKVKSMPPQDLEKKSSHSAKSGVTRGAHILKT